MDTSGEGSEALRAADIWANWWDPEFFKSLPEFGDLYHRIGLDTRAGISTKQLIREIKSAKMNRVVISATAFPGSPVNNDHVAAVVEGNPETLVGCASVDPRNGMQAVRELRRAVETLGFRGLKLLPFLYDRPPNDAIYYPLYAACVDLGIPALILTGHTATMRPSEFGRPLYLDDIALHFPELTIIAGHAGYPWTDELISLAWKHPNLFIDTSGHRPKYFPPALRHYLNSYGRDKVLFGTGYPLTEFESPVDEARAMGLKPESLNAFLWDNAARIWEWE